MNQLTCLISAVIFAASTQVMAFDLSNLSDDEREALGDEIRSYLLENPEVIVEAVQVIEQRNSAEKQRIDEELVTQNAEQIFADDSSWVGGNQNGDVTLVEFIDYRCGYCRRTAPEVKKLINNDDGIRLVIKEFPILGNESVLMSRFAISTLQNVGPNAYSKVHDALIELEGAVTIDRLRNLADTLDLDADIIMSNLEHDDVSNVIRQNHELANTLNISGTPSFIIPHQIIRGALPADQLQSLIEKSREQS